jgi:hypothetical protein
VNHGVVFHERVARLPWLGLGLSVDLYDPNLVDLVQSLTEQGLAFGYLEVFKASETGLREARRRLPQASWAYHGEGLWLTQPDFRQRPCTEDELESTVAQLKALDARWINHECASKQIAGYSFGTYLPPLFTREAASVVAEHAGFLQARLDRAWAEERGPAPLVLLELPPWTYFGAGDLEVPAFFRQIADQAPCGFVLDIGHLWTVYRYSGAWRVSSLRAYVEQFLDAFPLERVVQIHLAGLAAHERVQEPSELPLWIDSHGAAIPSLLFETLTQVLAADRLVNLKGVAIEVDTKDPELIVQEFGQFRERYGPWQPPARPQQTARRPTPPLRSESDSPVPLSPAERGRLQDDYRWYAEMAAGVSVQLGHSPLASVVDPAMLARYRDAYLPHEILHWGGDLPAMFPKTCRLLDRADVSLDRFVAHWFREPRFADAPYDFFLLKVDRFVEFVREALPWGQDVAAQEAADLRVAYRLACEQVGCGSRDE